MFFFLFPRVDNSMKNLNLYCDKNEIGKSFDILSRNSSAISQLKTDLCNVISLFHGTLAIWSNERGINVFRTEVCQFLSNYIEKIVKNQSPNNGVDLLTDHLLLERVQKNRNSEFIQLCKELFQHVNEHGNVVGGILQARVVSPGQLCSIKVFSYLNIVFN